MWREYFSFNKTEQKGLIVQGIIIVVLLVVNFINLGNSPINLNLPEEELLEVEQFLAGLEKKDDAYYMSRLDKFIVERYDSLQLFEFDPNTADSEKLLNLGLTEKQIETVLSYRDRGGYYSKPADFRKTYGIRQKQFELLEPFIRIENRRKNYTDKKYDRTFEDKEAVLNLDFFDPNTIDKKGLINMGFSSKIASTVLNYRQKGGFFYKPEDFGRIYGVDQKLLAQVIPFIQIEKNQAESTEPESKTKTNEYETIELNTADTALLSTLPGIGSVYAGRIVKFREYLGGYYAVEQLLEVYGLDNEIVDGIKHQLSVNTGLTAKMDINTSSRWELRKHKYITDSIAKAIVDMRIKQGYYKNTEDLLKYKVLNNSQYEQIRHYIKP